MKEQIQAMWVQATESMWPRPGKFTAGEYDYNIEKFAELIVKECLFIIDDERKPEMVSRIELWKQLVEHFGVD